MIQFEGEFGTHVLQRLQNEAIIWLTTVSWDVTPQPNPVWFYWDGKNCLIYSKPGTAKLRNIERNPRVALNFEGATETGGDVVILTGVASIEPQSPPPPDGYVMKYQATAKAFGYTWEQLHTEYSVAIRIQLIKYRGF
jgi:PPOX class probable F420-dependent enzyme